MREKKTAQQLRKKTARNEILAFYIVKRFFLSVKFLSI